MKFILLLTLSVISNPISASEEFGCLPDSDLKYETSGFKGLDNREKTDDIIRDFKRIFAPYVKDKLGKELKIMNDWENPKVNAHATKDDNGNPLIKLNGGMVRHPDMKTEGIYFILCHELGHFFGGAPRQYRGRSEKRSWSSAEGQADYFAATKCLPKVFDQLALTGAHDNLVADPSDQKEVDKICSDRICSKILLAGLSATKVFSTLKPWWKIPSFKTPNKSRVGLTELSHPDPQCRLDTIVSGSFCNKRDVDFHPTNPNIGACIKQESQRRLEGSRPNCWYKHQPIFE